ncbi:hypothetical protein OEZ86_000761 [Tetradesmus obliquus]|nr:hypothetical protein OEZ86_000761 [Tetradesmus obliquus]
MQCDAHFQLFTFNGGRAVRWEGASPTASRRGLAQAPGSCAGLQLLACAPGACIRSRRGTRCTQCLPGFVPAPNRTACGCPAGSYLVTPGTACAACPMNSYCRPATIRAQPCPGLLVTARTGVRSLAGCVNPPGFRYVPSAGQPSARPCELGTYSPGLAGQTACSPCPPGTATDPAGLVGEQTDSSSCKAPPGYSNNGDGVYPCAAGSFKSGYTGLSVKCTSCEAAGREGFTTAADAATSLSNCTALKPGYAPVVRASSDAVGWHSEGVLRLPVRDPNNGLTLRWISVRGNATSCFVRRGMGVLQSREGDLKAIACPADFFGTAEEKRYGLNLLSCTACPLGQVTSCTGVDSPASCEASLSHPGGTNGTCSACPENLMTGTEAAKTQDQCVAQPGFSYMHFTRAGVICPDGTFVRGNSSSCWVPAGVGTFTYYGVITAQCLNCGSFGLLLASNKSTCELPAGTGSTSLAQCESIQAGYAPRDSSGPILTAIATVAGITGTVVCPRNYYCQGGIVTGSPTAGPGIPVRCPGGLGTPAASASNIGVNNCMAPPGYAYVAGSPPSASACLIGQYTGDYSKSVSCSTCPAGLITSSTASSSAISCKIIAAGLAPVISSVIQTSPVAAAAVSTVTTNQCPAGSFCIGGDITTSAGIPVACSSHTTGLTSASGSNNADDCHLTLPGYGYNAATPTTATMCAAGTFNAGSNQLACQPCPTGFTTSGTGATSSAACTLAAPGYGYSSGNTTLCAAGTYNAGSNQEACQPCLIGLTTSSAGASSSTDCNSTLPGYGYINGPPANATLCAAGTYNTGGNQLDCQACTNGLTTQSAGSSFCSAPPGYYYSSAKSAVDCTSGTYQDSYTSTPATACLNCTSDTASYSPRTSASDCYTPTAVAVQAVSASILTSSTGDIIEWQDRSNAGIWTSVAVDASGRYMAAAQSGGLLWYSQDKGVNWAAIANSSRNWVHLTMDNTGTKIFAVASDQNSTVYMGTTSNRAAWAWSDISGTSIPAADTWSSIAANGDGTKLLASKSGTNAGLFVGTFSGSSWTWDTANTTGDFRSAAVNDAGDRMFAATVGSAIQVSLDSGEIGQKWPLPDDGTPGQ